MTSTATCVPQNRSRDIPFNKLVLSQTNVRQVDTDVSIDTLAEDIATRGLLQSLNVRPILDTDGQETGRYEVPAGGRRYRALEKLVHDKRLAKTALIPCVVKHLDAVTSMEDDSLAENTHRVALHPLDQYKAFLALRRQNMSEEDIAARYFVSVNVVKQRLRLAAVSPMLLDLYARDELKLEHLTAFSVTGDHARQEQVWANLQAWQKEPYHIRRILTESAVASNDRRAVFVGLDAYEAAGGEVLRDLFSANDGGWLQDAVLLDRLVAEKLRAAAEELSSEGWKWIEVLPSRPFDHLSGLRKIKPVVSALSDEAHAVLAALKSEYTELNEAFADFDDLPEAVDQRIAELEAEIEALERGALSTFDPADVVRAGVVVSIGRDGQLEILRAFVRPEDEQAIEAEPSEAREAQSGDGQASRETAVISLGGAALTPTPEDDEGDLLRPLPEKLILELTAYRTLALRDAVARHPRVAMTLLLHKLVGDTFGHHSRGSCLQAYVSAPALHAIAPKGLNDSTPASSMDRRKELWADAIPGDDQDLWDWLNDQTDEVRSELLAFCVSHGINAICERVNPHGAVTQHSVDLRLKSASRVAAATNLDLVGLGWRPTAESYLNRVPRPRILEAVREGCGERAAQLIDHLKKGDMVVEAERLLADAGWLPEPMRDPDLASLASLANAEDGGEGRELPNFLADDRVDTAVDRTHSAVAAE